MEQTTTTEDLARRERKAKRLAAKLFFELQGIRYSLRRTPEYPAQSVART